MNNLSSEIVNVNQYILNHKKEFNKEIGEVIRNMRNQKDVSIDLMASRTLMQPSYIAQIENGVNGLTLNKFVMVCNALETDPGEVLENFLYTSKLNEDLLYNELQNGKNISKNILDFMKLKH